MTSDDQTKFGHSMRLWLIAPPALGFLVGLLMALLPLAAPHSAPHVYGGPSGGLDASSHFGETYAMRMANRFAARARPSRVTFFLPCSSIFSMADPASATDPLLPYNAGRHASGTASLRTSAASTPQAQLWWEGVPAHSRHQEWTSRAGDCMRPRTPPQRSRRRALLMPASRRPRRSRHGHGKARTL